MDSSYTAIILFIIVTIGYYVAIKPPLTLETIEDGKQYISYTTMVYTSLFTYFLAAVLTQFGINATTITTNCGGSVSLNVASAAYITFIPWIFIFGALIGILIVFPGFKSAFSNVVGYFAVAGKANVLLTELLINQDISKSINQDASVTPESKEKLQSAADAIIKLVGNTSILINQIVPENFQQFWEMLTPLMKPAYQNPATNSEMKKSLLDLVIMRDNIGEAMWYVYTGILIISITQYQIVANGCKQDVATMEANHAEFLKNEAKIEEQNKKAQSTVYKVS